MTRQKRKFSSIDDFTTMMQDENRIFIEKNYEFSIRIDYAKILMNFDYEIWFTNDFSGNCLNFLGK